MMGSNMNFYDRDIKQIASDDKVIHISYDNLVPGEYEKRVIFGNMCGSLVRMRCIFEGNDADVFYITAGLSRFDEYIARNTDSMQSFLGMILNVLKAVRDCGNYLIPENEISLRSENIFFSDMNGSVRLMYLPGFSRDGSLGKEAVALTERAEKLCSHGMLQHDALKEYRSELLENENDIHEMISLTEEAMRRTFNIYPNTSYTNAFHGAAPGAEDDAGASDGGMTADMIQKYNYSTGAGTYHAESGAPALYDRAAAGAGSAEKRLMVREEPAEYGASGVIKRHIREFINELVS